MVTSMMVNFLFVCITLVTLPKVNPTLANKISIIRNRNVQQFLGWTGIITLTVFLLIHVWKDLSSNNVLWYHHSTIIYSIVMLIGSMIFFAKFDSLKKNGVNTVQLFQSLPNE